MKRTLWVGLVTGCLALGLEGEASACGGCFHPPPTPAAVDTVVTGHRMAFSISPTRTVLWDQIKYSGNPAEFGWVLPITPGAYVESSTDAWFESLDAWTDVQVSAPTLVCANPSPGSGCNCGSADSGHKGNGVFLGPDAGVTILHEGTVGPYETVTLRSTNTGSLRAWLTSHGYVIPPDIDPVIDAYISEGADFIALRLIPGTGVNKMTPVRVVTPTGKAILPLRMVQAGTGSIVDIVLYVIAEQRYGLADLTEVSIDKSELTFDYTASTTNYLTLHDRALADNQGLSFLTTFAGAKPFISATGASSPSGISASSLAQLYLYQAFSNDGNAYSPGCDSIVYSNVIDSSLLVSDTAQSGTLAAADLSCDASTTAPDGGTLPRTYSDLSAALIGMHPSKTWLTRLEMRLPREGLTMDCHVAPASSQTGVSNQLQAVKLLNAPCERPVFLSRVAPRAAQPSTTASWAIGLFMALGLTRRLRGRRTR